MAQTFTAYFQGVQFGSAKNMAAIWNTSATEVLSIYRVGLLNTQTSGVTGVLAELIFRVARAGTPSLTGGTAVTPTPHDSSNTAPASATYSHNSTLAGTQEVLRRINWSTDEPAVSTATNDEFQCIVPWNIIFDSGYGDSNVQPLVLRGSGGGAGQLANILCNTATTAGTLDSWWEFTKT